MNDATTIAIAEVLRRWHDREPATVIPFPTPSERALRIAHRFRKPTPSRQPPQTPRPAA